MKKLLITAAALLVTVSTYAQGVVVFGNSASSLILDGKDGLAAAGADGIRAALYWAPLSDPDNFTQIGAFANVGVPVAGTFSGGNRTTGNATAPGAVARFQVRAWESAYGATFEEAIAAPAMGGRVALRGVSNIMEFQTGAPPASPPTTLINNGLQGFTVVVPEPSVVALGIMGVGALLLLRRRK
jgi:hypothetical protein